MEPPATTSDAYTGRVYSNQGLEPLVEMVGDGSLRILDVGCGDGTNLELLGNLGHSVCGLTISLAEAESCRGRGMSAVVADATANSLPFSTGSFDALIFSHVLEHVPFPAALLERARDLLTPQGAIYAALPNVLYYRQRLDFARGKFRYADFGILDRTHLRFFDLASARQLFEDAGFRVVEERFDGGAPSFGLRRALPSGWGRVDAAAVRRFPGLFGYQFMFKAVPA